MAQTEYTYKARKTITIMWKCTKCGAVNVQDVNIYATGYASGHKHQYDENAHESAKTEAEKSLKHKQECFYSKQQYSTYKELGLLCKCNNCNHRESWSAGVPVREDRTLIEFVLVALSFFTLAFIVSIFPQNIREIMWLAILILGVAASIVMLIMIQKRKQTQAANRDIASLPETAFPVLVVDGKLVANKSLLLEYLDQNKVSYMEKKESLADEISFCRMCGKKIPEDSSFCPHCGAKV
ncbi:MAG: zinc-ribbon domain-containing protein [Clostridia bacterium]|nr:zinc-ribbon domain-containing protein [Clostridia bacterium]